MSRADHFFFLRLETLGKKYKKLRSNVQRAFQLNDAALSGEDKDDEQK